MFLVSLEMSGFKSFPDKIKLTFDKGMTAVVGPNGSGKSNVGDALLWVLGEQSSKKLRGQKMEDVIFSGAKTRGGMNIAKVSLALDNRDRELPIDKDEVIVQRKLYRNGESEYKINDAHVRLKDIYELFMDTGIGKSGYSLVGQGKIGEIVSAKSEERREIFEEAAGISKYGQRKKETEKKLAQTEENLVRIQDIKEELETRVEPLREEARKAKEFLTLSEEKTGIELAVWLEELEEVNKGLKADQQEREQIDYEIQKIEKIIEETEEALERKFHESNESAVKIDQNRREIESKQEKQGKIQADMAVLKNDISHNKENIEKIEERKKEIEGEKGGEKTKLAEEQQKINSLKVDKTKKEEEYKKREEELVQQIKEGSKEEQEVNKLEELQQNKEQNLFRLKTEKEHLEKEEQEKEERKKFLQEKQQELQEIIKELKEEEELIIQYGKELEEEEQKVKNIKTGYGLKEATLKKQKEILKKEVEEGKQKEKEIRAKLQINKNLEENKDGFYHSVKRILKEGKEGRIKGILGSVSDLILVESIYGLAIETALGSGMQNIVTKDEKVGKECIQYLKREKLGRGTFLPLNQMKSKGKLDKSLEKIDGVKGIASDLVGCEEQYKPLMENLLGRVLIVENMDIGTLVGKENGFRFKIVTLDGQQLNAGGSLTGGSAIKNSGIFTRKSQIIQLEKEAEKEVEKQKELEKKYEDKEKEWKKIEQQLENQKKEEEEINFEFKRRENEEKILKAKQTHYQEEYERILKEIENKTKQDKENEEKREKNQISQEEESRELETIQKKLREVKEEYTQENENKEKLVKEINDLKIEIIERTKDLENREEKYIFLEKAFCEMENTIKKIGEEKESLGKIIKEKEEGIRKLEEEREKNKKEIEEEKERIEKLGEDKQRLEKESITLRKEVREYLEEKEKLSQKKGRGEEKEVGLREKRDRIIGKIWEEYSLSKREAEEKAFANIKLQEGKIRLGQIKEKIKNLGNVHVSAIEEYGEVKERYEFLSKQMQDIVKSKEEIKKIIQEIVEEMEQKFSHTFEQIQDNFNRIFKELFGGGEGNLILTDADNLLETGIEIMVQPPGKKVKSLSLLSGGEQAFVAIAIYFAIFHVKPASFCILDEIEAALDDMNVQRFAKYIKTLSKQTQFITVTHRRGTMEEADVLYGITMEEEGISKGMKLNVHNIEESFL